MDRRLHVRCLRNVKGLAFEWHDEALKEGHLARMVARRVAVRLDRSLFYYQVKKLRRARKDSALTLCLYALLASVSEARGFEVLGLGDVAILKDDAPYFEVGAFVVVAVVVGGV